MYTTLPLRLNPRHVEDGTVAGVSTDPGEWGNALRRSLIWTANVALSR